MMILLTAQRLRRDRGWLRIAQGAQGAQGAHATTHTHANKLFSRYALYASPGSSSSMAFCRSSASFSSMSGGGVILNHGRTSRKPLGNMTSASAAVISGRTITSSPCAQFAGVPTRWNVVSAMQSMARSTSKKFRPVVAGYCWINFILKSKSTRSTIVAGVSALTRSSSPGRTRPRSLETSAVSSAMRGKFTVQPWSSWMSSIQRRWLNSIGVSG
mmetsp:Transcript_20221/g.61343  ORF Transcript_20221/g.61343 Transcript_20221/m.61343 type:complete len:215 (+) Transcript_20221:2020-2664(+)